MYKEKIHCCLTLQCLLLQYFRTLSGRYLQLLTVIIFLLLSGMEAYGQKGTGETNVVQPTNPPGAPGPISGPIQRTTTAQSGATGTYTVTAASGATGYSWITSDDNVSMTQGTTTSTLTIPAGYSGSFTIYCNAYNTIGQTPSPYPLGVVVYGPAVSGTVSPSSQSVNYNVTPYNLTGTAASGSSEGFTYQWQNSPNNSTWSDLTGATSLGYVPPTLTPSVTTTNYYRLVSTSSTDFSVTSNVAAVTIYPQLAAGTISPSGQSISTNTAATLTATAATGGNGIYTYQWQSSANNSTWTNITGATATGYTSSSLTATTYYRRIATSNGATSASNTATVTVTTPLSAGTISPSSQELNYNATATLTGSTATGGNGTYAYQWQSSPDNSVWTTINGATATGYTSGNLAATIYYRRVVTSNGTSVNSNVATITVYPQVTTGTISPSAQQLNYNTSATLTGTAATGGNGVYTYQWQSSADNSTWTSITGATATGYTSGNLAATIYYRRVVTSNGTGANSNVATVTVYAQLSAGTISPSVQQLNYDTSATLTGIVGSGGNGTYTYQWQSSPDNTTWANITGATATGYTSSNLTATRYYRRVTTSNGLSANSATATATVYGQVSAVITPGTQSVLPNTTTSLLSCTATGGNSIYTYQWQNSADNIAWVNISGATSATYNPVFLSVRHITVHR
jgi:hypothetical protein